MFGLKTAFKLKKQNKIIKQTFPTSNFNILNVTDISKISIGKYSYGSINVIGYSKYDSKLRIGNFCSISQDVTFILGGEHNYNYVSTYPFKKIFYDVDEAFSKGDIIIEDDAWIGYGVTILSGVTIGKGAIIGAKSIVAKNIPPYAIYANGKIIKYRFNEKIINELLKIDYSTLSSDFIRNNFNLFYKDVTDDNVNELVKLITDLKNDDN